MGFFSDIIDGITGGDSAAKSAKKGSKLAGDAALEGSEITADYIARGADASAEGAQQALYFLSGRDQVPDQISTAAQQRLAGIYGLPGGTGNQQGVIDRAMQSPIYNAIMATRDFGEDAILRNAAATGGLRSGNVQNNLYQYNQQLGANALAEAYAQQLSGLQGLSQLDTLDQEIAQQFNELGQRRGSGLALEGQVRGQGIADQGRLTGLGETAAGQAIQAGRGGLLDLGASIAGAFI